MSAQQKRQKQKPATSTTESKCQTLQGENQEGSSKIKVREGKDGPVDDDVVKAETLDSYGVKEGSTLHLSGRLFGGSRKMQITDPSTGEEIKVSPEAVRQKIPLKNALEIVDSERKKIVNAEHFTKLTLELKRRISGGGVLEALKMLEAGCRRVLGEGTEAQVKNDKMIWASYREHAKKYTWSEQDFENFSGRPYLDPGSEFMTSVWSKKYSEETLNTKLPPEKLEKFWDFVEERKNVASEDQLYSISFEMLSIDPNHARARSVFNEVLPSITKAEADQLRQVQVERDQLCERLPLQDWKKAVFFAYCKSVYSIATQMDQEADVDVGGKKKPDVDVVGKKMASFVTEQLATEEPWNLGHVYHFLKSGKLSLDLPSTSMTIIEANVRNVAKAYALVLSEGLINNDNNAISSLFLCRLHRQLYSGKERAGIIREDRSKRLNQMLNYINYLKSDPSCHPIETAVLAHYAVVHVHPYEDGNGRVCRMLQDHILMSTGFVPISIPDDEKVEYFDVFYRIKSSLPNSNDYHKRVKKGPYDLKYCGSRSLRPLINFMESQLKDTMKKCGKGEDSDGWSQNRRSADLYESLGSLDLSAQATTPSSKLLNTPVISTLSPLKDAFLAGLDESLLFSTPTSAAFRDQIPDNTLTSTAASIIREAISDESPACLGWDDLLDREFCDRVKIENRSLKPGGFSWMHMLKETLLEINPALLEYDKDGDEEILNKNLSSFERMTY
uniref:Fido domain-containing protein n=1 Tax=Ditylenchus dipsaci TaxID=166011 RepID=A0A915DAC9_9BILA